MYTARTYAFVPQSSGSYLYLYHHPFNPSILVFLPVPLPPLPLEKDLPSSLLVQATRGTVCVLCAGMSLSIHPLFLCPVKRFIWISISMYPHSTQLNSTHQKSLSSGKMFDYKYIAVDIYVHTPILFASQPHLTSPPIMRGFTSYSSATPFAPKCKYGRRSMPYLYPVLDLRSHLTWNQRHAILHLFPKNVWLYLWISAPINGSPYFMTPGKRLVISK